MMVRKRALWRWLPVLAGVAIVGGCTGGETRSEVPDGTQDASSAQAPGTELTSKAAMKASLTATELLSRMEEADAPLILDVRSPEEYAEGHIPGAINIPYDQIGTGIGSLESHRGEDIVVYCRTGRRARVAEEALREAGFTRVLDLEGHMTAWSEAELPVAFPAADCC